MAIQNWSNGTLLVDLPGESKTQEELEEVVRLVQERGARDVVMDFTAVTILNSTCLATLVQLREQLLPQGRRLVLCSLGRLTHGILVVTGLTEVFDIRADRFDALAAALEHATEGPHEQVSPPSKRQAYE